MYIVPDAILYNVVVSLHWLAEYALMRGINDSILYTIDYGLYTYNS